MRLAVRAEPHGLTASPFQPLISGPGHGHQRSRLISGPGHAVLELAAASIGIALPVHPDTIEPLLVRGLVSASIGRPVSVSPSQSIPVPPCQSLPPIVGTVEIREPSTLSQYHFT